MRLSLEPFWLGLGRDGFAVPVADTLRHATPVRKLIGGEAPVTMSDDELMLTMP